MCDIKYWLGSSTIDISVFSQMPLLQQMCTACWKFILKHGKSNRNWNVLKKVSIIQAVSSPSLSGGTRIRSRLARSVWTKSMWVTAFPPFSPTPSAQPFKGKGGLRLLFFHYMPLESLLIRLMRGISPGYRSVANGHAGEENQGNQECESQSCRAAGTKTSKTFTKRWWLDCDDGQEKSTFTFS